MSLPPRQPLNLFERLREYALLMRMDRPIGTLLLLWPTLWAVWLAGAGRPSPQVVLIFAVGVFLMRSAGCVINDFADRDLDPHVSRTRDRPLAARRLSPAEAVGLYVTLGVLAFVLVLQLNSLTILLSFVGAGLATVYPFLKRITHLPQFALGVAFAWGIPMAFAAQTGEVPAVAWMLVAANICWAVAYDTMYAMADREDDLRIGVKSTAILFGRYDRGVVGVLQVLTLLFLALVGAELDLNRYYLGALVFAGGFFAYQQTLIRGRQPAECFRAFLNNAWFGSVVFMGIVLSYL